jgi:hypothetical protein
LQDARRRQTRPSRIGDAAKGWDDNQIKMSFDNIAAGLKPWNGGGLR